MAQSDLVMHSVLNYADICYLIFVCLKIDILGVHIVYDRYHESANNTIELSLNGKKLNLIVECAYIRVP